MNDENVDYCDNNHDGVLDPICPKVSDFRDALQVLRDYMLFSVNGGEIHRSINSLTAIYVVVTRTNFTLPPKFVLSNVPIT